MIDSSSPGSRGSSLTSQIVNVTTGEVETIDSIVSERDAFRDEALANEERRATAQDALDDVLVCNDETNARYQEEIRRRDAQNEELDVQNEKLRQRLEYLERESVKLGKTKRLDIVLETLRMLRLTSML